MSIIVHFRAFAHPKLCAIGADKRHNSYGIGGFVELMMWAQYQYREAIECWENQNYTKCVVCNIILNIMHANNLTPLFNSNQDELKRRLITLLKEAQNADAV